MVNQNSMTVNQVLNQPNSFGQLLGLLTHIVFVQLIFLLQYYGEK